MDAFHKVFHVSMLRKCITHWKNVISEPPPDLQANMTIVGVPVRIVGRKLRTDRKKKVKLIEVVWDCEGIEETTWEPEEVMKVNFRIWFEKQKGKERDLVMGIRMLRKKFDDREIRTVPYGHPDVSVRIRMYPDGRTIPYGHPDLSFSVICESSEISVRESKHQEVSESVSDQVTEKKIILVAEPVRGTKARKGGCPIPVLFIVTAVRLSRHRCPVAFSSTVAGSLDLLRRSILPFRFVPDLVSGNSGFAVTALPSPFWLYTSFGLAYPLLWFFVCEIALSRRIRRLPLP
ncbi:unnamed protein product [Arabidopsis halleri]